MALSYNKLNFHYGADMSGANYGLLNPGLRQQYNLGWTDVFAYDFENFFHPLVGELIRQLNQTSVAGMLDPVFLGQLTQDPSWFWNDYVKLPPNDSVQVTPHAKEVDVTPGGPYANYNWELVYHIPVMIDAVPLEKERPQELLHENNPVRC